MAGDDPAAMQQPMADDGMPAAGKAGMLTVRTVSTGIPAAPELVVEDGAIRLQLEDAIGIALSRNLEIAVQRYDREQALFGTTANRGIYDLRSSLDLSVNQTDRPNATQLEGVSVLTEDTRRANFSLTQLTPWGGEAQATIDSLRSSTNSRNQQLNPYYSAGLSLGITQPLLRDFGRLPTERGIFVARIDSDISRESFESQVADILQQVERAYWNLVEAKEQLVVAQESLQLANDLDHRNRIQVEVGTLAPIELVQSEATIALRQEDIITAAANLRDAGDELLRLLNLPDAMAQGLEIEPLTKPSTDKVDIDVEQAIQTALDQRTEVRTQRLTVQRLEIDSKYRQNQKLPSADLRLGYDSSGDAGTGPVALPGGGTRIVSTDLNDAFSTAFNRDFIGWTIGLTVSYPLQNRTARANSAIADLALDRGKTQLDQVELGVTTEVRAAARRVSTAAQQIESARATSRLQQRNLEAEQKRYENGMSDSFRIAQIQNDLTAARSREVTAVTNYRIALVDYYRSIGNLLEQDRVELLGPEDPAPQRGSFFSLFH